MSTEMPKDLQRWEKTRQRGKWKFVLFNGVLCWGAPMFFVLTFFVNCRADKPPTPEIVAVSAALWTLGGFLFGLTIWTISERRYQKFLATHTKAGPN